MDVAAEVGADAVAHGCTGKGNDQASTWILLLQNTFMDSYISFFSCDWLTRFGLSSPSFR